MAERKKVWIITGSLAAAALITAGAAFAASGVGNSPERNSVIQIPAPSSTDPASGQPTDGAPAGADDPAAPAAPSASNLQTAPNPPAEPAAKAPAPAAKAPAPAPVPQPKVYEVDSANSPDYEVQSAES